MENSITSLPNARLIHQAFLNTFDSIIVTDTQLELPGPRILYVNQRFSEMTGYTAKEVLGRTPRLLQGPASDRSVLHYLKRRLQAGQDFFGEIINYRKDGTAFFLQWRILPVRDDQNTIVAWIAVQHDISRFRQAERELARVNRELEQRVAARTRDLSTTNQRLRQEVHDHQRTEARLRDSEQRFRLLVESVTDYAISMLDPEGFITSWNAGAQRFKGYRAEEIIGEHFSRFYPPEDILDGVPQQALSQAQQQGHYEGRGWRVRKNGERFWAHEFMDAIYDDQAKLMGFTRITRDITEQRRAEEALNHTMEALLQSNASLEQFAYAASHDLKAPLRNIFSFIQLLEEDCQALPEASPEMAQYLYFIRDNAQRMSNLVDDVLEYSRIRADHSPQVPVDLNQVIERVKRNLQQTLHASAAVIDAQDLPTLPGHEPLLVQLFQNLLSNAIKFQPLGQQPHVKIRATCHHKHWILTVKDNGIGIDPANRERIFDLFQRLHRHSDYPGTGIGLAICKKAVERHGGTIQVHSTPGEGTVFIIQFPHLNPRDPA